MNYFWKIHMLLLKDSSAHKCVGVDVCSVTEGFWFAVKGGVVHHFVFIPVKVTRNFQESS